MLNFEANEILKDNLEFEAFDLQLDISDIEINEEVLRKASFNASYASFQRAPQQQHIYLAH